jgi:hypothetical protein
VKSTPFSTSSITFWAQPAGSALRVRSFATRSVVARRLPGITR